MKPQKKTFHPIDKLMQRLAEKDITYSDCLFLFLATIVESVMPVTFFVLPFKMDYWMQFAVIVLMIQILFGLYMEIDTFFQKNHVEFLYLQLLIFAGVIFISGIFFALRMNAIAAALQLNTSNLTAAFVTFFIYVSYTVVLFLLLIIFDAASVLVLLIYGKVAGVNMENPYIEQFKAARTVQSSREYANQKLKEAYERKYGKEIDPEDARQFFEQAQHMRAKQKREKQAGFGTRQDTYAYDGSHIQGTYVQQPLFDYTKHFKQITDLDQVKPRYHELMKKYHPDNAKFDTVELCQEIQEEYQTIAKRYNL